MANFEDAAALLCHSLELFAHGAPSIFRLAEGIFILLYGVQTLATGHPTRLQLHLHSLIYPSYLTSRYKQEGGPYSHVGQMEVKSDLQILIADPDLC